MTAYSRGGDVPGILGALAVVSSDLPAITCFRGSSVATTARGVQRRKDWHQYGTSWRGLCILIALGVFLLLGGCTPIDSDNSEMSTSSDSRSAAQDFEYSTSHQAIETTGTNSNIAYGGGASAQTASKNPGTLRIVASTPLIADVVRNVAPQAHVTSLIPPGVDPHTFEPSLATIRDVAHAQIAFSNQLLLEQQSLIETIDTNLPRGAKDVPLAQAAVEYGAKYRQLVEDASLSTIWLGFRADGTGASRDKVRICATGMRGPGKLSAFTTGTFGQPTAWFASNDGFDDADCLELPTNAHTHMSWGFSHVGRYLLDLRAELVRESEVRPLGTTQIEFLVGQSPDSASSSKRVVDSGHFDITACLDGGIKMQGNTSDDRTVSLDPSEVLVEVPHSTATVIPDTSWGFLGKAGNQVWILAQAVVGRHVHGEIDPHLWHDVSNIIAYVDVIEHELVALDPDHADEYITNAQKYRNQLGELDTWMREVIASIPQDQRTLVTTHDSFGYLADAYDMKIAGFVAPNPSLEPSVLQLSNLVHTLESIPGKAVFLEPNSRTHAPELLSAAHSADVKVCEIYSDTFSASVHTYVDLMRFNAKSLKSCLDPQSLPAWEFTARSPVVAEQHYPKGK